MQAALLHTHCMDVYNFLMYIALRVALAEYTKYEDPWRPLQQVYDSENADGSAPSQGEQYDANGIFMHPLYGFVQLHDIRKCMT